MSAVGDSPIEPKDEFTQTDFDHETYLNHSLNKIQSLLTSILHCPEGKLPTYKPPFIADASFSLSDSPIMTPVKPWRIGSFTHHAYVYNDAHFKQALDNLFFGVVIELKKIRDLCARTGADLAPLVTTIECNFPFPEKLADESKGFFNFIAALHNNKDFIGHKLAAEGLNDRKFTILSNKEGKIRSEKYWQIVTFVNREITCILTKNLASSSSSSSSTPVEKNELEDFIQKLSNSTMLYRGPYRDNITYLGSKMQDFLLYSTGKLTRKLSPEEWKGAKLVSEDDNWYIDIPNLTEEIKAKIKEDLKMDLARCKYDINGQIFSSDGTRVEEMIQTIKTSIFGEMDDSHAVAYRLAFMLTQGTLNAPFAALMLSTNNFFGDHFLMDTHVNENSQFIYNRMTQTATISIDSVQQSFINGNPNGKVKMIVNLQFTIEYGNIVWGKSNATYTLEKIK